MHNTGCESRLRENGNVDDGLKDLLRPLYHRAFRCQLRLRFWLSDHFPRKAFLRNDVPTPPALLRYRVCESLSLDAYFTVGKGCADQIIEQARAMGTSFDDVQRVLDFGCGCGRTLRWLMERYPAIAFYGADVDPKAIEWCLQNLRKDAFVTCHPLPPLPFESCYFDVVYCFSVFTHLDERMQDMWFREISRVLKPGGLLILTVHGERVSGVLDHASSQLLRDGGFVHKRSRKLAGIVPDWYNTSWHTESYIVARLGALFSEVRFTTVPDGIQDLVAARNVSNGT